MPPASLRRAPAFAASEILITQAKALAGNVTPGDAAGFPVALSLPGTHKLASNIYPTGGTTGIGVAQRNVTIDLNGFELHGAGTAAHGITCAQVGTVIRKGTITGFKHEGIHISGNEATIEGMRLTGNGLDGATLSPGVAHRIFNSTASDNGRDGIACTYCVVTGNVVVSNGRLGILGAGGTFVGNYIAENTSYGLFTGSSGSGHGNNTLYLNNGSTAPASQVAGTAPLHPNFCSSGPCP